MPSLQPIWVENPEEEPKTTLYARITNSDTPPLYDDIMNSDLSKEDKVKQIQYRTQAYQDDLDKQLNKDLARMKAGTALSAASFHPFFNVPYVGTGIGGAMYDLGQGIVEGDTAGDLAKRAGRGFVIGETIGAIPYVGKALGKTKAGQAVINSAPVQAVGNVLNKAGEKFANSKLYDALMTDIKAFNPNKQTVYHGSPYDFEKFSNEAIGTGEGAQAHGYGHYAAKSKDVGEGYRKQLSRPTKEERLVRQYGKESVLNDLQKELDTNLQELQTLQKSKIEQAKIKDFGRRKPIDYDNSIKIVEDEIKNIQNQIYNVNNPQTSGQLYKLSIPKDNVMLREDALMSNQPNMSNLWDEIRLDRVNKLTTSLPKFKMALGANDIDINKTFNTNYFNDALEMVKNNPEKYKDLFLKDMTGRELYGYLENVLGSRKAATEYLQQRGIKGISYNGGIDGEARVIFNPDDIVIGRKYYNQPNLYEQLTGKQNTGALIDSLYNR